MVMEIFKQFDDVNFKPKPDELGFQEIEDII